jgi:putative peptide zinc metalloprotease protein
MSITTIDPKVAAAPARVSPPDAMGFSPRLLAGTELIGQVAGSGLREPPYLVRRCDGQVVQLSRLLYEIASRMDGRPLAAIAAEAGQRMDVRITSEQVAYVAEHKLVPLGLVAPRDGSPPSLERVNALLALRFRAGVVGQRPVNALASVLRPLFLPPVVIATLTALAACDVWLATPHGIGAGLRTVIHHPTLGLALFALTILSLAFHECGHAAACRYGGARPGRIGIGVYLVWPVFYTDVTDSYRLNKTGRLRTDLGGVYFNALFALGTFAAYLATGYEPLLVLVISQQMLLLDQFVPWVRLDGYHIVSDLIGVSNLFTRIKPVIKSLRPRRPNRPADRRVSELKPWARAAVTTWVISTLTAFGAMGVVIILYAPGYLTRAWQSLNLQFHAVAYGARAGSVVDLLNGTIGAAMLLLPVAGITLTYLLICRRTGALLALRQARVDPTLAPGRGPKTPPQPDEPHHPVCAARQLDPESAGQLDRVHGLIARPARPQVGAVQRDRRADHRAR